MLAIRLQRTGRSGHAQFRVIVQDDRFSPKSGRVVAYVGSYDPHTKAAKLDGEKIGNYMANGAQPSERVAQLLKKEGIKLPVWVKLSEPQKRVTRHPEKLRRNRPQGAEPVEVPAGAPAPAEPAAEAAAKPATDEQPAADAVAPAQELAAEAETPAEAQAPEEKAAQEQPVEEPETKA